MNNNSFPGGVWPVMLTPYTSENKIDYDALKNLIEWYINQGASGLFSVCQSSEMFQLSLQERVEIARFVKEKTANRIPVIASGHISESLNEQINELNLIANTGVDAVILITNRLAKQEESDIVWMKNLEKLLQAIPSKIKLGFYECPYPYKRVLSKEITKWCADSGRFYFLKDTSCDTKSITEKLNVCKDSNLKIYNANTATLLESLKLGCAGYSGVMANMQCKLYEKLTRDFDKENLLDLSDELTLCALIEYQCYPVNAKYYLQTEGIKNQILCRTKNSKLLTDTFKKEVNALKRFTLHL